MTFLLSSLVRSSPLRSFSIGAAPAAVNVIFDLDGVLYPDCGIAEEMNRRMCEIICEYSDAEDLETATEMRKMFIREFGTTFGGLRSSDVAASISFEDFYEFSFDIDVGKYLPHQFILDARELFLRKFAADVDLFVFSNSSKDFIFRILDACGIAERFRDWCSVECINPDEFPPLEMIQKPDFEAFQRMLQLSNLIDQIDDDGFEVTFVDDTLKNVVGALEVGMNGIFVTDSSCAHLTGREAGLEEAKSVDCLIVDNIFELERLPGLAHWFSETSE